MGAAKRIAGQLLPVGSKRRAAAKRLLKRGPRTSPQPASPEKSYQRWIAEAEPLLFKDTNAKLAKATYKPLVSIVVPCYNTPENYIEPLVDSVLQQSYPHWQLCLADGSSDQKASQRLQALAEQDDRIAYVKVSKNLGIAGNTNEALHIAIGEFVAFMDHDDTLSPYALAEVIITLNQDHKLDLIYSDEDKLSDDGRQRLAYFFKPDWSPELLLGVNYIAHLVVVRKSIVDKIAGLRIGFDGAQDYDFLLRFTEQTNRITRIPKILYHWRMARGSTAVNVSDKSYADTAGQRALGDATKRRNVKARVLEIPGHRTNYRLQYSLPKNQPLVSIIIPFKDKADLLKKCVGSILQKSTYRNYELILISNNSTETELFSYLGQLKKDTRCKVSYWDQPFNYSAINNYGRTQAKGEYLVLLNNDTEVITPNWLEELIGVASQPEIGAVGPMLLYPNKTIQHAGVILGLGGMAGHVFRNHLPEDWTFFGFSLWPRNYLAVTAACLAVSAKKFDGIGGLDETFTVAGNDVALGISLYEAGYRNVYWPFCQLMHYENVSVGSYNNVPKLDYTHSLEYYRPYFDWRDPYFNPNLDLMDEHIGLRRNYESGSR